MEPVGTQYRPCPVIIVRMASSNGQAESEWSGEQSRISPNNAEKREGPFGMSWALLLTTAFLTASLLGIMFLIYLWNKKAKIVLAPLMHEENGNELKSGVR